jgi:hypothetical protein
MQDFLALSRELAREQRLVVGVFDDPAFAGHEIPQDLRLQHIQQTWGAHDDVRVVALDAEAVRSYSLLFKGRLDMLVYPYGPLYPMDAPPFYTGQTVAAFLKRGGALLTTGGVPFGRPANADDRRISINGGDPRSQPDRDPLLYDKWIAALGIKYYLHPHLPPITHADTRFLPALPATLPGAGCPLGIVVTNSAHSPVPAPPHGNVFPERTPARQVIPLLWGADAYGQTLAINALLVQDFETGSRRIHFAHETLPHPLSPAQPHFAALMDDLLTLLANPLMVVDAAAEYACYRQGESVRVRGEVRNTGRDDRDAALHCTILHAGQTVFMRQETVSVAAGTTASVAWEWTPGSFDGDEYELSVTVERDGATLSEASNGFVVWDDAVIARGPRLAVEGSYLGVSGDTSFIMGTNYYESTRGEIMWYRPDVRRVARDLRQMHAHGITYIRPHYHHLKWFKDYLLFQHGTLLPYFQDLAEVESPLPDERAWRIWDMVIYLCQKYGIVYGGDLFTLVPEEMGDPRGWFPPRESVYCAEKRGIQRAFLRQLNLRYRDVPGISWDLWNEPVVPLDALRDWAADLRGTLEETGVPRLITVGGGSGELLGAAVDYIAPHGQPAGVLPNVERLGRPVFMQEIHLAHGEDLPSELRQAEDVREAILVTLRNGACGLAPWSWCRQMRLWQDNYHHHHSFPMEKWDDRLGLHVHDDATVKPAGQVYRDLAALLATVPLRAFDERMGRLYTTRGELKIGIATGPQQCSTLYHVAGPRCFAAMERTAAAWSGRPLVGGPRGAYVYVFTPEDSDVLEAAVLYARSESPGALTIHRRGMPRAVHLVERSRRADRQLDCLDFTTGNEGINVLLAPTQHAYWVRVTW